MEYRGKHHSTANQDAGIWMLATHLRSPVHTLLLLHGVFSVRAVSSAQGRAFDGATKGPSDGCEMRYSLTCHFHMASSSSTCRHLTSSLKGAPLQGPGVTPQSCRLVTEPKRRLTCFQEDSLTHELSQILKVGR
uniref:Uncharacterized protein n=1 Tax=Knipowitschia caucasica TaxID=637954 RepID=A0AAV2M440_KNICA